MSNNTSINEGYFFFISLIAFLTGNLKAQSWKKKDIELLYNKVINEYCTNDIKTIFENFKNYPYIQWVNYRNDHNSILISLSTVIHEMQHLMDDEYDGENGLFKYYLNDSCIVKVPQTPYFTSDKLNDYIPASVSDSIFRYGIYVGKKDGFNGYKKFNINNKNYISSSIYYGIFGLMEEFLAYYRGLQILSQIYPYFLNYIHTNNYSEEEKVSELGVYKYYVYQLVNSFYEFQLFIAWYLQYAQKEETNIYRKLYDNKPLRYLFSYIHDSYQTLIDKFIIQFDTIPIDQYYGYTFLHYIKLDDTEEDFCKFIYYFDFADDEYKKILIEVNENDLGEKSFRFIGNRKERRLFKKYYNQLKKDVYRNYKDLASAIFMYYLSDQEAQMQFLKRQTTHEVIQEISNFKSLNHHESFCKANQ